MYMDREKIRVALLDMQFNAEWPWMPNAFRYSELKLVKYRIINNK